MKNETIGDTSLAASATRGVLWSTGQKWLARIGGLVTIAIVARQLTPEDFGLVAVAMVILPMIYLIADFGFSTYIVQLDEVSRPILSTAFWYSFLAGGVLSGGLAFAGVGVEATLGIDGLAPVLIAISPAALIAALGSVPTAILRRRMAFRALALQSSVGVIVGQIAAVAIALAGGGVWALVVQVGLTQLGTTALAWVSARWVPGLQFSRDHFRRMARFGGQVVGVEAIAMLRSWGETALIVAFLGVSSLGVYNIAQRLIQVAQDLSTAAIAPVSTVVFAQVRSDGARLRGGYIRALGVTYAVVIPIMVVITVGADMIIPLLFGPQWEDSVLPAQLLAVAAILVAGAVVDHGLFYGLGRPGRWLSYAVGIDALTVLATAIAVHFGLVFVALGLVAVAVVATIVRWFLVSRVLEMSLWPVARPLVTILCAGTIGAAGAILVHAIVRDLPSLLALALVGTATGLGYVLGLRVFASTALRELWVLAARVARMTRRSKEVSS